MPTKGTPRRRQRTATQRLNRAQQRAMEVRTSVTVAPEEPVPPADLSEETILVPRPVRRVRPVNVLPGAKPRQRAARPPTISREQEYRYIRSDLTRLLLTAGILLLVMVGLLLLI